MKLIELSGKNGSIIGNYAQVDDEDYEMLNQYKWHAYRVTTVANLVYAKRNTPTADRVKGKNILIRMHREILKTDAKVIVDHKDRNGLNNQKNNLRVCTHAQNMANSRRDKTNTSSKYRGVCRRIYYKKYKDKIYSNEYWYAACKCNGRVYTKIFKTEVEAAMWYNEKAIELQGEFAILNIITN